MYLIGLHASMMKTNFKPTAAPDRACAAETEELYSALITADVYTDT